jgi:hypothetical protein
LPIEADHKQMDLRMRSYYLIPLLLFISFNTYSQFKSLDDFYSKMYFNADFTEFTALNTPTVDLESKQQNTGKERDTSRVNNHYVLNFKKHPYLEASSHGGRLEMFTSVCADGSCVYQVSQKLFISFSSYTEARSFLDRLIQSLNGLEIKESFKKTDEVEEYVFSGTHTGRQLNYVVFKLTQNKEKNDYDLFIGL